MRSLPIIGLICIAMVLPTFAQERELAVPVEQPSHRAVESAAVPQASGLWIAIGPDMQILPPGLYRFIFVPPSGGDVQVTSIDTSGGPVPPGPDPPGPDDLGAKLKAALAKVTDTDKAKTAAALVETYESLIESAESGDISGPSQFATAVNILSMTVTSGKPSWNSFKTVVSESLGSCVDVDVCAATLQKAVDALKGVT